MSSSPETPDTPDKPYEILGIDFSNFLGAGIDLSGIIDTVSGKLNFEISSSLSCLLSIFIVFILIFVVTQKTTEQKGLNIPGIGILGPQQPLVIQMPIQESIYPFNNSPFPRST